ncbi:MAG: hypothetical protein NTU85_01165 [Candidatus Kaiserbacteria bacterium]|nr:hypothetical protein [Candidatus Kaiserbacteria bacterium]
MQAQRFVGFSLIEILVSIFIMSMMLLLFQAMLRSAAVVVSTRNQDAALTIARNEIEKLRTGGYAAVPASGSFPDPLLSTLPLGTATLTTSTYNAKTKQVTAKVSWQERNITASSSVSLSTLITQVGGLQ